MMPCKEVLVMTTIKNETDLQILLLCLELESKKNRKKELDVDATLEKIHWSLKHELTQKTKQKA